MKKTNPLILFLFIVCIIFVISGLISFSGIFNSLSSLIVPIETEYSSNDSAYAIRSLIQQVPLLTVSIFGLKIAFSNALKLRREEFPLDKETKTEDTTEEV